MLQLHVCLEWIFHFSFVTTLCLCSGYIKAHKTLGSGSEKHHGLASNTCFCHHNHRWRYSDFPWKITSVGSRKISAGVFNNFQCCNSNSRWTFGSLVVCNNATTAPSTSWCPSQLISLKYLCKMSLLLQMSSSDVSVVCRKVNCWDYSPATGCSNSLWRRMLVL